jgi:hypothetical protein
MKDYLIPAFVLVTVLICTNKILGASSVETPSSPPQPTTVEQENSILFI